MSLFSILQSAVVMRPCVGLYLITLFLTAGCASQQSRYRQAVEENTIVAYERYIEEYSESDYSDLARDKLAALEYEETQRRNTVEAYKHFIKTHLNSVYAEYAALARQKLDALEYEEAQRRNTVEAYKHFIKTHLNSAYAEYAAVNIEQLDRERLIKAANDVDLAIIFDVVKVGNAEHLAQLIQYGVSPDLQNVDGASLLCEASRHNQMAVAELLIEEGADVRARDADGRDPMSYAAKNNFLEMADLLLAHGAPLDESNDVTWTPLQLAVVNNHVEMVDHLMGRGADIDRQYSVGEEGRRNTFTQLTWAANHGRYKVAELLIDKGADVDFRDMKGQTPLMHCINRINRVNPDEESIRTAELLIARGADVNAKNDKGWSILSNAIGGFDEDDARHLDLVHLLIEKGADIHAGGSKSPLFKAASCGKMTIAEWMLSRGANADIGSELTKYAEEHWKYYAYTIDSERLIAAGGCHPLLLGQTEIMDYYREHEYYLKNFPDGVYAKESRSRLEYLRSTAAKAEIRCPSVIEGNGYWKWESVLSEVAGGIGYVVKGSGGIVDANGDEWTTAGSGSIYRGILEVQAGSTAKDSYWLRGHQFCNGFAEFTWRGRDQAGNLIELKERVKLQHTACPGPDH